MCGGVTETQRFWGGVNDRKRRGREDQRVAGARGHRAFQAIVGADFPSNRAEWHA